MDVSLLRNVTRKEEEEEEVIAQMVCHCWVVISRSGKDRDEPNTLSMTLVTHVLVEADQLATLVQWLSVNSS